MRSFGLQKIASRIDRSILVVLILPWLQLLTFKGWIFSPAAAIDHWLYVGYMLRLEQYLNVFPETYYGSRLSWLLPGHLLYKIFPPIVANYVLHLGVYYLAAVALYLILKHYFGWRTGLVTAVAMGCYHYFILAVGWDYVDGIGIAYCLLTILMLTYASTASRYWQLFMFLSGLFYGALVVSNIAWVFCTPSLLVHYLFSNRFYKKRSLTVSFLLVIAGFIVVSTILGLINYSITRNFLFYLPSINFVRDSIGKPNPYKLDWSVWLSQAFWLLLPLVTFIGSIFLLYLNQITKLVLPSLVIGFQLCFILFFSIQVILDLKGSIVLQTYFYSSYLIPFLFLAIGSQLSIILERLRKVELGLALFLPLFISTTLLSSISNYYSASGWFFASFAYCSLYLLGVCSLLLLHMRMVRKVIIVAGMALVLTLTMPSLKTTILTSNTGYRTQQEDAYLATIDVIKVLQAIDPEVQLAFWYDLDESYIYRSISSTYLWSYRLISEEFPSLSNSYATIEQVKEKLQQHPKVVILSKESRPFSKAAMQSLSENGFQAKPIISYPIKRGKESFTMTIIKVSKLVPTKSVSKISN